MINILLAIPILFIITILSLSIYKYWEEEEQKKNTINIGGKSIPMSDISKDTYTFIGGKPYTKKQFFKAVQGKRLSQEEIEEGGKMATQLQNRR